MAETSKQTTPKQSGAHEERGGHGRHGDRDPDTLAPLPPPPGQQPPPRGDDDDDK
jgi:hypothetical protein